MLWGRLREIRVPPVPLRPGTPEEVAAVAGPAEVYEALREAHARADADAAAALYAPDAEYHEPDNAVHRGRDEIRNFLAAYFATRGPIQLSIKREVTADSTVLAEWTSAYTDGGRRSSGTPGVSVIELGRHGIVYHRDYQ